MKQRRQSKLGQRFSMRLQWINEFSDIGSEISQQDTIKLAKMNSSYMNTSQQSHVSPRKDSEEAVKAKKHILRRSSSLKSIIKNLHIHDTILNTIDDQSFSIFKVTKELTRDTTFSLVSWKIMDNLDLLEICDEEKFACFIDKIYLTYSRDVAYHNDIHGADVA